MYNEIRGRFKTRSLVSGLGIRKAAGWSEGKKGRGSFGAAAAAYWAEGGLFGKIMVPIVV